MLLDIIDVLEEEYEEIEDIPQEGLCSFCYGEKLRLMQKSEYSAYDEYYAEMLDYVNESKPPFCFVIRFTYGILRGPTILQSN